MDGYVWPRLGFVELLLAAVFSSFFGDLDHFCEGMPLGEGRVSVWIAEPKKTSLTAQTTELCTPINYTQWALLGHQAGTDDALSHDILIWPFIVCSIRCVSTAFVHLRWDERTSSVSFRLVHILDVTDQSGSIRTCALDLTFSKCIHHSNQVKCKV